MIIDYYIVIMLNSSKFLLLLLLPLFLPSQIEVWWVLLILLLLPWLLSSLVVVRLLSAAAAAAAAAVIVFCVATSHALLLQYDITPWVVLYLLPPMWWTGYSTPVSSSSSFDIRPTATVFFWVVLVYSSDGIISCWLGLLLLRQMNWVLLILLLHCRQCSSSSFSSSRGRRLLWLPIAVASRYHPVAMSMDWVILLLCPSIFFPPLSLFELFLCSEPSCYCRWWWWWC